ncbi:hypothetical protein PVT67_07330 [Gallaecimonas kandeliae]|uniref:hypothetical protein n=1 Tax=Gallaecimonas kandeliae TaxID=3029055 RepID=UPI0026477735|nr:hypothetical protein [Gallaecimonas kandeliae]WKE67042.1 hypothetical protein PVT67_07330 [Gallaecimonas kandeliae]
MADRLFDDYFSVQLACEVRLDWLPQGSSVPDQRSLAEKLPPLRRQLDALEAQQQQLWSELKEDRQSPLVRLLELMQHQIALLGEQLLSLDAGEGQWLRTVHFSAGGFSLEKAAVDVEPGRLCQISLKLPVGLVRGFARLDHQDEALAYLSFVSLLESDREKLVRLALQTQSDQLRARRAREEK